jgi:SAM-dependent methyltransferase
VATHPTPHPQEPDRNLWEGVWEKSTVERPIQHAILNAIAAAVDINGAQVLEVGCGSGVNSVELRQRGARAMGLDYSPAALKHARNQATKKQVSLPLMCGDVFRLPFRDGAFDVIFSQGLMEHFTNPLPSIIEQARVVRPGGLLCIDVPQTYHLLTLYKRWHIRRGTWFAGWETNYALPQLETLMRQAGLNVVSSYGWMYFPALAYGVRNLHTLDERYKLPVWIGKSAKRQIEKGWQWLEKQRWYYRWMGCIGVIARKPA